jgi:glycosyltransferase involved in cell wall biosynthesis
MGLKILFRGWFLQHSYGIVNCFQLVQYYKRYGKEVDIYVEEMEYFRKEWNQTKKLVFGDSYNSIIKNFKQWNGEEVDLVYSITYPYDISEVKINGKTVPKCVFYTAEFAMLNTTYFVNGKQPFVDEQSLQRYIRNHKEIYYTSPSEWSSRGLIKYVGDNANYNRVITHGVEPSFFYQDSQKRKQLRDFYKVKDSDVLMMNIGAMTQNKGIVLIIQALHHLVHVKGQRHFKVLLKGSGDLYQSKLFLEIYFDQLQSQNQISKTDIANLLKNHIIFIDKTISYSGLNDLYNACDVYLSPYLAEGFNLVTLEALTAGLPVLVPKTGSTREYMNDLYENGGSSFIMYVDSKIGVFDNGMCQNMIEVDDLIRCIESNTKHIETMKTERFEKHTVLKSYISEMYSWEHVAELLHNYFLYIIESSEIPK